MNSCTSVNGSVFFCSLLFALFFHLSASRNGNLCHTVNVDANSHLHHKVFCLSTDISNLSELKSWFAVWAQHKKQCMGWDYWRYKAFRLSKPRLWAKKKQNNDITKKSNPIFISAQECGDMNVETRATAHDHSQNSLCLRTCGGILPSVTAAGGNKATSINGLVIHDYLRYHV